jgi:hypothetical protein
VLGHRRYCCVPEVITVPLRPNGQVGIGDVVVVAVLDAPVVRLVDGENGSLVVLYALLVAFRVETLVCDDAEVAFRRSAEDVWEVVDKKAEVELPKSCEVLGDTTADVMVVVALVDVVITLDVVLSTAVLTKLLLVVVELRNVALTLSAALELYEGRVVVLEFETEVVSLGRTIVEDETLPDAVALVLVIAEATEEVDRSGEEAACVADEDPFTGIEVLVSKLEMTEVDGIALVVTSAVDEVVVSDSDEVVELELEVEFKKGATDWS